MSPTPTIREAAVYVGGVRAGVLTHLPPSVASKAPAYVFEYTEGYDGPPVSLALPVRDTAYRFGDFPSFFDGLLPEGWQLEALLRQAKLDRGDLMGQLLAVGEDPVGAVSVRPLPQQRAGDEDVRRRG